MIAAAPFQAEALASLHAAAFRPEERWNAEAFAVQLTLPGTFGFLDDRGGFILARAVAGEAEILTLAVHPRVRRRGIGRDLVTNALAEASRRGAQATFLEVAVSNTAARALYIALGFVAVGHRRSYYASGDDAVVLAYYNTNNQPERTGSALG